MAQDTTATTSQTLRQSPSTPSGWEAVAVGPRPVARIIRWYRDRIENGHTVAWDDVAEGVRLPNGQVATWPLDDPSCPITLHLCIEDASEALDACPAAVVPEMYIPRRTDVGSFSASAADGGEQAG